MIENDSVLRKWFPEDKPVVFGSITEWTVVDLIPTQLYALNLIREKMLNPKVYSALDFDFRGEYLEYLKGLFKNRNDQAVIDAV